MATFKENSEIIKNYIDEINAILNTKYYVDYDYKWKMYLVGDAGEIYTGDLGFLIGKPSKEMISYLEGCKNMIRYCKTL